jgi:hypothetical protein
MTRLGVDSASVAGKSWRIAILTAVVALGGTANARAAGYYWSDPYPGFSQFEPPIWHRRHNARHHHASRIAASEKQAVKPQAPLIVSISIQKQKLRIYDANGFFAETPISTGMPGHSTPMGVFSIIQKQKWHRSNIYSGAPMPYMQRITWSGVAMHAGVLPGHPASHGCIRMPMAFAIKMYSWTRMGARVVVTPGEMTPASFSHPLLPTQKIVPQPDTEPQADASSGTKSDRIAAIDVAAKSPIAAANLELRTTVGESDAIKAVTAEPAALHDRTHTAEVSHDLPAIKPSAATSDAAPSADDGSMHKEPLAGAGGAPSVGEDVISLLAGDAAQTDVKSGAAKPEAASPEQKRAESEPSDAVAAKTEPPPPASTRPDQAAAEKKPEAQVDNVRPEASKPDVPGANEGPDAIKADIGSGIPDLKDQTRLPDPGKPAAPKPGAATIAAPKRSGQIAVFISRKDSKLYARQNFAPLFDVPVTIAPSDRPLGTHVFTAQVDKNDANVVHWSVMSLPVPPRHAARRDEGERRSRRHKIAGPTEVKEMPVPDSPAEALDRLTIPADAMARITQAITTGSSIIVSDQGINAGETGEGTDFIVSLR